jgi:hypothetical protein
VFTSLFSEQKYAYEFYRARHPEDCTTTSQDVRIVTIQNVLTADEYNDLGFLVGDTLMVLAEAQSTWSPNIALRALLYTAQTMKNLIHEQGINVYSLAPARLPRPELYVVYTGRRRGVPDMVTLSEACFGGIPADIEATVHVLNEVDGSLPGQYIDFARTVDACRSELGPNERAVRVAIADCLRRDVLAEYLTVHEAEVVSIMMKLYDEEEVLRTYIAAEVREASAKAAAEAAAEAAAKATAEAAAEVEAATAKAAAAEAAGRLEGARVLIKTCRDLGLAQDETAVRVADGFRYSPEEAQAIVEDCWSVH